MSKINELANEYARVKGDDCLCQRNSPGTPVGEHIHIFCGCDVAEAYEIGFKKAKELAIDRVRYCRFSIILENDSRTMGYVNACSAIQGEIEMLGEKE